MGQVRGERSEVKVQVNKGGYAHTARVHVPRMEALRAQEPNSDAGSPYLGRGRAQVM